MGPFDRVLQLLDLEQLDDDRYEAITPSDGPARLFGGQVAAQSLRAATLTVEGRSPHSLHAYFVRPGRPGAPLLLDVARVRDGRSFTTRTVTASQKGGAIFVLSASFHLPEDGDDWQLPAPTGMRDPEVAAGDDELPLSKFASMSPFEMRPARDQGAQPWPMHPFWVRVRGPLPDDAALHACLITFMSDMGVVGSARARSANPMERFSGASLDHALWFHRPARADEWLLFDVAPVSNFGARGLARGTMHTAGGVHVVSLAQEALLRPAGTVPLP